MQQLSALLQLPSGSDRPYESLFELGLNSNTRQSSSATKDSHYYYYYYYTVVGKELYARCDNIGWLFSLSQRSIVFLLGYIQNTCPSLTKQASVYSILLHPDQLADNNSAVRMDYKFASFSTFNSTGKTLTFNTLSASDNDGENFKRPALSMNHIS